MARLHERVQEHYHIHCGMWYKSKTVSPRLMLGNKSHASHRYWRGSIYVIRFKTHLNFGGMLTAAQEKCITHWPEWSSCHWGLNSDQARLGSDDGSTTHENSIIYLNIDNRMHHTPTCTRRKHIFLRHTFMPIRFNSLHSLIGRHGRRGRPTSSGNFALKPPCSNWWLARAQAPWALP